MSRLVVFPISDLKEMSEDKLIKQLASRVVTPVISSLTIDHVNQHRDVPGIIVNVVFPEYIRRIAPELGLSQDIIMKTMIEAARLYGDWEEELFKNQNR